jgi:hypothetical protein
MRTRRSWRNQDRLYKAIGNDLKKASEREPKTIEFRLVEGCEECAIVLETLSRSQGQSLGNPVKIVMNEDINPFGARIGWHIGFGKE